MRVCVCDIQELVDGFSIEVTPKGFVGIGDLSAYLPAATRVYVTCLAGSEFSATIATATEIIRQGFVAVPHIALRGFSGRKQLRSALQQLKAIGVDELLLLAGGHKRPEGTLASTLDLLGDNLFEAIPFTALAFAGHPEGHPLIAEAELWQALKEKQRFADRSVAHVSLVTQFSFLADPLVRWCKALTLHGITVPVHAGIPGVTSARSLIRHARLCGAGQSIRFLLNHLSGMQKLIRLTAPDKMIVDLAAQKRAGQLENLERVHFFPFGGFHPTVTWLQAIRCGRIRLHENGGFTVTDK